MCMCENAWFCNCCRMIVLCVCVIFNIESVRFMVAGAETLTCRSNWPLRRSLVRLICAKERECVWGEDGQSVYECHIRFNI